MRSSPHPSRWTLPLLAAALLATALGAMLVGGAGLSPATILRAVAGSGDDASTKIILDIRLPRVLLAIAIGAGMGLAGVSAQTLFRNPLASPYVLGVSNGSAIGAVAAMLLVGKGLSYGLVPLSSIAGGLLVSTIVYAMSRRSSQFGHALLLCGIAISAFASALTAAALYLAGERLQTLVFWLMGGLWQAGWRDLLLMLPVTAGASIALILLAPAMNVALVGERSAVDLGVSIRRLQILLLILITLVTAIAVSVSGVIGFVGLVVPHLMRLLIGADHRRLIPASALGGALLLLLADTLARIVAAPAEVPVGIVTALVGAPVFLILLQRRRAPGGWS